MPTAAIRIIGSVARNCDLIFDPYNSYTTYAAKSTTKNVIIRNDI